jgi:hypothetical protein
MKILIFILILSERSAARSKEVNVMVDLEDCTVMLRHAIRAFNDNDVTLSKLPASVRKEFYIVGNRIDLAFRNEDALTAQNQIAVMRRMLLG